MDAFGALPINDSVWSETGTKLSRPPLGADITTDVLIIGGGICGILIAHQLTQAGVNCIIAEAKTICSGITKNTTAKITAQHGLIYSRLMRRSAEKARQYYDANNQAINRYRELTRQFSCDLEDKTAFIYAGDRRKLEQEAAAYQKLGISPQIYENLKLPIKTNGAIGMENQAQFHPLKLLYALAQNLSIYENTFISEIEGNTAYASGRKITAKHIVLATHFPMVNVPGLYFMKLCQHRSYVIALEGTDLCDGMYLGQAEDSYSFRTYGNLLFIGGGGHKTGIKGGGYAQIRALAQQAFPNATEKYCWATQDCITLDKIPYIGRHRSGAGNLYVATGFNKWGMTGSMVAAEVITDLIMHGKCELEELYSPQRSMLTRQLMINIGAAAKGLLTPSRPRCTHMGCKLHFNAAEKSWDCSCHGSRFDRCGNVINNPAKRKIDL